MVAVLRSSDFMPPVRWIRHLTPPPESLGQALRRLRMARDLDQEDVREALGLGQTSVSNYENDKYPPPRKTVRRLNDFFEQPPNTLSTILRNYQDWQEAQDPLPGPSVAVPNEPELVEHLRVLIMMEREDIPGATQQIREIAKGAIPRGRAHEEPAG